MSFRGIFPEESGKAEASTLRRERPSTNFLVEKLSATSCWEGRTRAPAEDVVATSVKTRGDGLAATAAALDRAKNIPTQLSARAPRFFLKNASGQENDDGARRAATECPLTGPAHPPTSLHPRDRQRQAIFFK